MRMGTCLVDVDADSQPPNLNAEIKRSFAYMRRGIRDSARDLNPNLVIVRL